MPAALKKDEAFIEIKEFAAKLKSQYSRCVAMFERAMEEEEVYSLGELNGLCANPVTAGILNRLVFVGAEAEEKDGSADGSVNGNADGSTDGSANGNADGSADGSANGNADGSMKGAIADSCGYPASGGTSVHTPQDGAAGGLSETVL